MERTTLDLPPAGHPPALPCANCGTALAGPFCAQCGQHFADYHQSVWRFVTDFLDNTFCWDNKLLRTLGPLFQDPGMLTREFMAGRRVRYVHPLRLFLFTSAVCLALLHSGGAGSTKKSHPKHAKPAPAAVKKTVPAKTGEAKNGSDRDGDGDDPPAPSPAARSSPPAQDASAAILAHFGVAIPSPAPTAAVSPAVATPSPGVTPPSEPDTDARLAAAIDGKLKDKLAENKGEDYSKLGEAIGRKMQENMANGSMERISQNVMQGMRQRLSWMMLALLPVFALMLRATYRHGGHFYFAHLVFSLHYHSFLLIFWALYTWLGALMIGTFMHGVALVLLLTPAVYLFLSLRRVYGGSVRRTWVKTALLGGMHLLVFFVGLSIIGALSLFHTV